MKIFYALMQVARSLCVLTMLVALFVPMLFAIVISWAWVSVSMLSKREERK
tara:strand:+ start:11268 stop:11420 length:153 start_codon:yes stop_codon:yes gene_type:complete